MAWDGIERRQHLRLSNDDKREIAELVYEQFQRHFQLQVGKGVIRFVLHIAWIVCVAGLIWLAGKGWLK